VRVTAPLRQEGSWGVVKELTEWRTFEMSIKEKQPERRKKEKEGEKKGKKKNNPNGKKGRKGGK